MAQIVSVKKLLEISKDLKSKGKSIVLVGGCFDILHPGHIALLKTAKTKGDSLFIFLESDEKVKQEKGKGRPVYGQNDRAMILSELKAVDYIVTLPYLKSDEEYDRLISDLKPDFIATADKDYDFHHRRTAELIGAKFILIKRLPNFSSSTIRVKSKERLKL